MINRITIEIDQEEDGRYIADVKNMPGVLVYGSSPQEAKANAIALSLRVIGDEQEKDGLVPAFELAA